MNKTKPALTRKGERNDMNIDEALDILHIVKCNNLGYCQDLTAKEPTKREIGLAIETVEKFLERHNLP